MNKSDLIELLSESEESAQTRSDNTLGKILNKNEKIVLFGAGQVGMIFIRCLRALNIQVTAYVDNDKNKQGAFIEGTPVYSVEKGVELFSKDHLFIISILKYDPDICGKQLEDTAIAQNLSTLRWKSHQEYCRNHWRLNRNDSEYSPKKVIKNKEIILKTYDNLSDNWSKEEYIDQIKYRLGYPGVQFKDHNALEDQYFPDDLFDLNGEIWYDCGAYDGDTIFWMIKHSKTPPIAAIAIEPDPDNFRRLCVNFSGKRSDVPDDLQIFYVKGAVGKEDKLSPCFFTGNMETHVDPRGNQTVHEYSIDNMKFPPPTMIKMDVEGNELDALKGAKNTIIKYSPILCICGYHKLEDIWTIPEYVLSIKPDYKLFIRRYAACGWEEIFYFIPPDRLK